MVGPDDPDIGETGGEDKDEEEDQSDHEMIAEMDRRRKMKRLTYKLSKSRLLINFHLKSIS